MLRRLLTGVPIIWPIPGDWKDEERVNGIFCVEIFGGRKVSWPPMRNNVRACGGNTIPHLLGVHKIHVYITSENGYEDNNVAAERACGQKCRHQFTIIKAVVMQNCAGDGEWLENYKIYLHFLSAPAFRIAQINPRIFTHFFDTLLLNIIQLNRALMDFDGTLEKYSFWHQY